MKSSEIRNKFLKYFEAKGHKVMPGSSLIPTDPTVLLTLAGMLQFKPIFLGQEKPKNKRVTTVQKCIRMNDIERVGKTARHHTFFEMLGNFSFGDYFKKEAVNFAWELLTKEFSLAKERLLIAVYEKDSEAYKIWKEDMGIPSDRIYKLGEDNNFWAAGATGPCGPCSEIYYDLGEKMGCGKPDCSPGCDCDRYLEVWNLVFIEYNRNEKGQLIELPSKNIDTGMGLERITSVLQGVTSNFDTDIFLPILASLNETAKCKDDKHLESKRIIADHIRAIVHLIADGVLPSNDGRGYVLRRLIRRGVRHGKILGINEPFLYKLAAVVADVNGDFYPELKNDIKSISLTIKTEEEHFRNTLQQGIDILNKHIKSGTKSIPGKEVFLLHDTYGFPVELTKEIAAESGVEIDRKGFDALMEHQKQHSRISGIAVEVKHYMGKLADLPPTNFIGYNSLTADARIIHIDEEDKLVVLERTVFYPESGGQVGDTGRFCLGKKEFAVAGTYGQIKGVIAHKVKSVKGLEVNVNVKAMVDADKRKNTSIHHTSTHLLHSTLRELYGEGLKQAGSHVSPEGFRFDFNHFGSISKDDLEKIERRMNELIKEKMKVDVSEASIEDAKKKSALMFFGEKYGEKVRMIKIGNFSLELCGGTHVKNTSDISFFKITGESSVSYGIRRIEAKAGEVSKQYVLEMGISEWEKNKQMFGKYEALELKKEFLEGKPETYYQFFRVTSDEIESLKKAVVQGNIFLINRMLEDFKKKNAGLAERIKQLEGELEIENLNYISENLSNYIKRSVDVNGSSIIECEFKHYSSDTMRKVSDIIKSKVKSFVAALFSVQANRVMLIIAVSQDLVDKGLDASALVKNVAELFGGGGGGKKNIAEAGGKDPSKIPLAFDLIVEAVKAKL
jgi:alanyl-tRNA synthetase